MPWKGVTVTEQKQRFLEDSQLNYHSFTKLPERFCISRKTAHKWINRFKQNGHNGFSELSRRLHSCPWQTDAAISLVKTFRHLSPCVEVERKRIYPIRKYMHR